VDSPARDCRGAGVADNPIRLVTGSIASSRPGHGPFVARDAPGPDAFQGRGDLLQITVTMPGHGDCRTGLNTAKDGMAYEVQSVRETERDRVEGQSVRI